MSSIDRLSILGVRSFDNQRSETIAFHTPLTLIVGQNGCGKTTIIECLKFATTGEHPPNTKGGAFIHDPDLCGEKEVMAQVKLSFKSTTGVKMTATRNMSLTVKKAARTFKTMEAALTQTRDGERNCLSSRHADMNSLVPNYLGVSKAILENVIFCHQDHSLWPMSGPTDLKKIFDEIFEALKYTKAIDNIKIMQKKQRADLELHRKDEERTKADKDRGKKLEKQAERLSTECDGLREQSQDLGDRIKQAARNAEEAWGKAQTAGMIVGQLTGKRIEQSTKEESVEGLRQNLVEMSDSDEDLQRMLAQYEERVQLLQDDYDTQLARYKALKSDMEDGQTRISAKERECGSYEAQAESHERQIQNREKLVKETARSHNIRGFDLELDDDQVQDFMNRITKMARDQNATFERARRETQEALQKEQRVLNQLNEQRSAIGSRKESAKQAIVTNDRKIGSLQNQLNGITIDEGGKVAMEAAVQEAEDKLRTAKADRETADWDNQARATEVELRKLDDQKEKLDAEVAEALRQAKDSAGLDHVQRQLKERERQLDTMVGAHRAKVESVIGGELKPALVEREYQRTLDDRKNQLKEAERQLDGTTREKEQLDFQLSTCRKEMKKKQQEVKTAVEKIKTEADCSPEEYDEMIRQLETTRDTLKTDLDSLPELKKYLQSCVKTARVNHKCKTCDRGFEHTKDAEGLARSLEALIKQKEFELGKAPEELKNTEEDLASSKAVAAEVEAWERLEKKEIPALQRDESKLSDRREGLIRQLEDQDVVVAERREATRDVEAIAKTVQSIAKLYSESEELRTQLVELSFNHKAAGLSRGLEQIQDDQKKVKIELRLLGDRLKKTNQDRERARDLVASLELSISNIRSKLSTAEYQLREKVALEEQVEELKRLNSEQRDAIRSIDKELQDLGPKLSQAQAKYDDAARRGADKDRELQTEASKLNSSVNQLKMANQEIDAYIERGGPEQLKRGKREVESLRSEMARLEKEQGLVTREVKKLEDQLRNTDETKRSISDNQRYRRDLRALQQVRHDIAELETHNAEEDKARYEREGSKWQMERNKLAAEQATVIGSLKSKDETLVQILADYDTEYKDAARKYKEAHIRVETTKACVEDLGRYGGALDKAIMKYHSLKMEEINRIVDELWRKTYQGTDVDTIKIKSESENVKANKSYNYRVCMVKQDAEMDMRGRCSAGQKVLACIIIRLALAECFGVNCGLIALDEPTTNLDSDNIRALAESLSEIIKVRRQQKNFQLIVITHDEEFLKHMGCSAFADVYYRVSRNESQNSVIERQQIIDLD